MAKIIIKQIKKYIKEMSASCERKDIDYARGYRQCLIDIGMIIEFGEEIDNGD